ncbi:MAG TPA: putative lipid II flippase FtsW [Deltaproteobacteria bacterium]|nr:putative lipid II flippase FtsW [Deltaproteobacteria bacterium]
MTTRGTIAAAVADDADRWVTVSAVLLVGIGIVMVYSSSYVMAMERLGDEYHFFKRHVFFAIIGFGLFAAASRLPYTIYRRAAYPLLIAAAAALMLIFAPGLGSEVGGARRWVRIGPVGFQPSEFAKLAVIIFLAYSLSRRAGRIGSFAFGFLPNVLIPGAVIALILAEPDLGTAVSLGGLVVLMNFVAGARLKHLAGLVAVAAPVLFIVVTRYEYMMRRILIFLDPWKDPTGAGFQTVQSLVAFASGGLGGVGLGEGMQKLFYLPEAHTDFILSVVGEEFGLIGVSAIMVLYIIFLVGGTTIAMRARDLFGSYLALGLTFMVVLQAMVNMAVVLAMLPPKGLPLPFVSYGGTSLITNLAAAGMLLNIHVRGNRA